MVDYEEFPSGAPILIYRDPKAALAWLEKAFGFTTHMVLADAQDNIIHAETKIDGFNIMVAPPYSPTVASPLETGGLNTQALYVYVKSDIDAHCARARAAGATIKQEPTDFPYAERIYKCVDPEGHNWSFAFVKQRVSHADMRKALGLTVRDRL